VVLKCMRKLIKQLLCHHIGQTRLIFSSGKNTHHDITECIKCGKVLSGWQGTRDEWVNLVEGRDEHET
jgi:hypothetical protein